MFSLITAPVRIVVGGITGQLKETITHILAKEVIPIHSNLINIIGGRIKYKTYGKGTRSRII